MLLKILAFWFLEENKLKWFVKEESFDTAIRDKFQDFYEEAIQKFTLNNIKNKEDAVAYIILFDQFPRNMFRNTSKSFATDNKALAITKYALFQEFDKELNKEYKHILYMPLMHSEKLQDQELSLEKFQKISINEPTYAIQHLEIIKKFGRFPHRNKILGRESTPEEIAFLKTPNSSF